MDTAVKWTARVDPCSLYLLHLFWLSIKMDVFLKQTLGELVSKVSIYEKVDCLSSGLLTKIL